MENPDVVAERLEKETAAFYKKVDESRRIDNSFAREDDLPLTEEEIAQIDAYWGKYAFAYPNIDYRSFQTFKNRCGHFDVRHCPGAIRTEYMKKYFVDEKYRMAFQNKGMLAFLYPDVKQPVTVARRMSGICYDEAYHPITLDEVIALCCRLAAEQGALVLKPSGLGGGRGIIFLTAKDAAEEKVRSIFTRDLPGAFVVQQALKQSAFMEQFNPVSVNTIRITTLLFQQEVMHLAALIRIGKPGNRVDNWCAGGSLLGIEMETGTCLDWAMSGEHQRLSRLPGGLDLTAEKLVVPNFEQIKALVTRAHYRIPYVKLVSWDIALDEEDTPVMIECNFGGMIQIHEATTGPLFGEKLDALLDEYLLKRFYVRFGSEYYICREYYDHIAIEKYFGPADSDLLIPAELRGKPVTRVIQKGLGKNRVGALPEGCSML